MGITITYYLDVVSSWCYWSEPAWAALKQRYEGRVSFQWKIALMDKSGLPTSLEQHQWYYRRSGVLMGSPFMLRCDWADFGAAEYLAPNCIAEAGKDFGFSDDRLRLALANAALREGRKVGEWDIAAEVVGGVVPSGHARSLVEKAKSPHLEKRVRASTEEFSSVTSDATAHLRARYRDWGSRGVVRFRECRADGGCIRVDAR